MNGHTLPSPQRYVIGWLPLFDTRTLASGIGGGEAAVVIIRGTQAPEGLKLEKELDATRPGAPLSQRRFDRVVMLLWAIALFYFGFSKIVLEPASVLFRLEQALEVIPGAAKTRGGCANFL